MERISEDHQLQSLSAPPPPRFQRRKSRRKRRVLESPQQPEPLLATQPTDKVLAVKKTKPRRWRSKKDLTKRHIRNIKKKRRLRRLRDIRAAHQAGTDFLSAPAHHPHSVHAPQPQDMFSGSHDNQSSTCGALGQCASVVYPTIHSGLSPTDEQALGVQDSYYREIWFSETPATNTYMCERVDSTTSSGVADAIPMSFCSDVTFDCNSRQSSEREPVHTACVSRHEGASMLQREFISLPTSQPSLLHAASGTSLMPIPVQSHEEDISAVPYLASTVQPYMQPHESNPTSGFQHSASGRIVQDYTQPCPIASSEHKRTYTVQNIPVSKFGKKIVAMDCEMVGCLGVTARRVRVMRSSSDKLRSTLNKVQMKPSRRKRQPLLQEISVAGRCSIVDYNGKTLYDRYIKPKLQILNLRTRWSGIKWSHLKSAVPFDEARAEILELLDGCIVVGHALENDYNSLNIDLPPPERIRDTSQYIPLRKMAKLATQQHQLPSLKKLAKSLLGLEIQKRSHSSLVDARVSMKLYKLVEQKWEKGKV